jgi:tRNA 2-thiouridine synthesizing protein A
MTPENMARYQASDRNYAFWTMLKEGYDHFEITKVPPKVDVCEKRYVFNQMARSDGSTFSPSAACPASARSRSRGRSHTSSYQNTYDAAFKRSARLVQQTSATAPLPPSPGMEGGSARRRLVAPARPRRDRDPAAAEPACRRTAGGDGACRAPADPRTAPRAGPCTGAQRQRRRPASSRLRSLFPFRPLRILSAQARRSPPRSRPCRCRRPTRTAAPAETQAAEPEKKRRRLFDLFTPATAATMIPEPSPQRAAADDAPLYDLRGLNCPLPVLKTRRRLASMPAGSLLRVATTDPLAVIDIPAFCQEAGHRLIESSAVEGGHRFLIERGQL